jgi:transposase InsO family protein
VIVERPDQVWSTAITYVPLATGFMDLAAVIDGHSRYVLVWRRSHTLDGSFCLDMRDEALSRGRPEVFNTDPGVQFGRRVSEAKRMPWRRGQRGTESVAKEGRFCVQRMGSTSRFISRP